jgi:DNA-binding transcriptional MerR regulator
MRMAQLSAESGVPVPTIKYYLREELLPPGELTSPNQARYDDAHLRRLRLVRALLDVGGLSVAQVRDVLAGIDASADAHAALGAAQDAITPAHAGAGEDDRRWAVDRLAEVAAARGWKFEPGHPVSSAAVDTLATYAALGHRGLAARLDDYAELAERVAELDVASLAGRTERESLVEAAVVGMVLGDGMFAALRRLAQERASVRIFRPAVSDVPAR